MSVMGSTRTTSKPKRQGYSPKEQQLLSLLSTGKPLSSTELVERLYDNGDAPYYAHQSVNSLMRSLIKKVKHNSEPFIINKSAAAGPYPTNYSILERKGKKGL